MKLHDFKQPVYSLDPHIYCSAMILVNDVPLISWFGEQTKGRGGYAGGTPINHLLLQSGTHKIVGKMFPRNGNKTLIETDGLFINFNLYELSEFKTTSHEFHPTIETPWDGLSEGINYPTFELKTEIKVELPFTLDGWQNSIMLSKIEEETLFRKVFRYYQQIHTVLLEHDASKFLELSKEKMQLQEKAFYFSEERKQNFQASVLGLFNQNLEVEPLIAKELRLQIMGYGKLVRLVKIDGTEPLQFKSPNPEEQSNIELEIKLHMRNSDKGFSII